MFELTPGAVGVAAVEADGVDVAPVVPVVAVIDVGCCAPDAVVAVGTTTTLVEPPGRVTTRIAEVARSTTVTTDKTSVVAFQGFGRFGGGPISFPLGSV